MEGSVILALLGLCSGLVAGSEERKIKDFDFFKFSGLWYEIAFAVKAGPPAKAHRVEKMRAVVLQLENGSLVLKAAHYEDHCVVEKTTAIKKDVPGMFTIVREGENKEVQVLSTDYETHAIMDVHFTKNGVSHQVLKLYSRSLDQNEKALETFRKVAQEHGIQEPDIHLLKRDTACVVELQGPL